MPKSAPRSEPQLRVHDRSRALKDVVPEWEKGPRRATALYAWLGELIAFEERLAILSGTPSGGLQTEMASRAAKKILILGRHLAPPAAPAAPAKAA